MTFVVLPRTMCKLTVVLQALVFFIVSTLQELHALTVALESALQTLQPGTGPVGESSSALTSHNTVGSLVSAIFQCLRFVSSSFRMLPIIMARHHSGIISRGPSFLPTISINFYGRFFVHLNSFTRGCHRCSFLSRAQLSIFSLISSGGYTLSCRPQINTSELFNHG